ncbi:MAG TPA: nicotinate (nicotinamide) nucleotide adenylyltransferase [Candidatus Faecousia excrementipullorum]|nr:nicotinate (nicotinamide) nucleotide adenylyltransferase [Candidatus Faecousia excrementipullorum]
MQRIGIYGGTFNPPHLGHLRAAAYGVKALELTRLLMIPSCVSPHKQHLPEGSATARQRLEMLKIALKDEENIRVSDLELNRGGESYTWETVQQLKKIYPMAELILFMGTDMFLSFDSWKKPEVIMENASIGVFYRGLPGEMENIVAQKIRLESQGAKVYLIHNPLTVISSTDLRRLLVFSCADSFLPEGVGDYIRENHLYGTGRSYRQLPMEELEKTVVGLLKPSRVAHVLGCRDTARQLAEIWGADPVDAARAGLLHDITKALDGPLQLTLCQGYGTILDAFSQENPKTLHALTGSLVAERIFGENPAVVRAIRSHTTGMPHMNTLDKIIYVADYMEPNRDFPGVEELRHLAVTDLDGALRRGLEMTISVLQQEGKTVSPESAQTLAWLNGQK